MFRAISTSAAVLGALSVARCGSSLPGPPLAPQPPDAFIEVPMPPPPAQVEIVPARPEAARTWVDGAWTWEGTRWRRQAGGWLALPRGPRYAAGVARRRDDGTLLYANPRWLDGEGRTLDEPRRIAEARTPGGPGAPNPP